MAWCWCAAKDDIHGSQLARPLPERDGLSEEIAGELSCLPRARERLATTIRRAPRLNKAFAAFRPVSPAPISSTSRPSSESNTFSARSTTTEATEIFPVWIFVALRTSFATLNAFWNSGFKKAPLCLIKWTTRLIVPLHGVHTS